MTTLVWFRQGLRLADNPAMDALDAYVNMRRRAKSKS